MPSQQINGYPNYEIVEDGTIISTKFYRTLKHSNSDSGYAYVNLIHDKIKKTTAVHKLVMEHFGPAKPGDNYVIDHKDGNKNNNHIDNLQWVTIRENTTRYYGNQDKKLKVLELRKQGMTMQKIAAEVGLSTSTVQQTILQASK